MTEETLAIRLQAKGSDQVRSTFRQVESGMARVNNVAQQANRALGGMFAPLLAAGTMAGIVRGFSSMADAMDQTAKAAQRVGVSVEALSALEYAAKLSGASFAQLETGLAQFSRRLAEVDTATNKATTVLKQFGVTAADDTRTALDKVANAFARSDDGARKTAAAMELFGESGRQLIPMLNQGGAGLADMADEAQRLGVVMDTETAQAAEQFNDNLTRLSASARGLTQTIAGPMIASLADLTNAMVIAAQEGSGLYGVLRAISLEQASILKRGPLANISYDIATKQEEIQKLEARANRGGQGRQVAIKRLAEERDALAKLREEQQRLIGAEVEQRQARQSNIDAGKLVIQIEGGVTRERKAGAAAAKSSAAASKTHAKEVERTLRNLRLQVVELEQGKRARYEMELATKGWTEAESAAALVLYDQVEALQSQQAAMAKAADDTNVFGDVVTRVAERMTDAMSDAFYAIFKGGADTMEDLTETIKDTFFRMLADLLTAAIANPIRVAVGLAAAPMAATASGIGTAANTGGGGIFGGLGNLFGGTGIGQTAGVGIAEAMRYLGISGSAGFNTGLATMAATPNWAFGIGGIGGSLLGSALFPGQYSSVGSSLGSTGGALIGAAFGGPVGAIIGGLLGGAGGGFLGSLFGDDEPSPQARIGQIGGRAWVQATQDLTEQQFQALITATQQLNATVDTLVEVLPQEAADAIAAIEINPVSIPAESFDAAFQIMAERLFEVAGSQLPYGSIVAQQTSADAWMRSFQALTGIQAFTASRASVPAQMSRSEAMQSSATALMDFAASVGANVEAQEQLLGALQQRYQAEVEYLTLIDQLRSSITATFDSLEESIRMTGMTAQETYDYYRARIDQEIIPQLYTATDPDQIASLTSQFQGAIGAAWQALGADADEQSARQMEFLNFIGQVEDMAQWRLNIAQVEAQTQSDALRSNISDTLAALNHSYAQQASAANQLNTAAVAITGAANRLTAASGGSVSALQNWDQSQLVYG